MQLQTPVQLPSPLLKIIPDSRMFVMGSCFSEHISTRLKDCGLNVTSNPFGTLFNPLSISQGLEALLQGQVHDHWFYEGVEGSWHSIMHSTLFSGETKDICIKQVEAHWQEACQALKEASVVLNTWGTAHVYVKDNAIVANCHKQPSNLFTYRRLSVSEILDAWKHVLTSLWEINPDAKVLFTVSPFRYMNLGVHENTLTKATLHLAIEELMKWTSKILYFPSYEIVIDELRDYRFYDTDMLHVSPTAAQYVWEKFSTWCFAPETKAYAQEWQAIQKALAHKPRQPQSKESLAFKEKMVERQLSFIQKHNATHLMPNTPE